jgi:nucleotide-binding universal stress UspA family protein
MNWKTILVPHDFSSSANHAAALARDEGKAHGSALVLLHVIDLPHQIIPDTVTVPGPGGVPISIKEFALNAAETHLTDLEQRLAKDGIKVTHAVRIGNPVDEILRFAAEEKVSLIVMGTHGRTGIRAFVAGSVTERVIRNATVPVLSVRHHD